MYSVSGIALSNSQYGWVFREPSMPLSELVRQAQSLRVPGRDGVVTLPAAMDSPMLVLAVQTPREHLEDLYALFMQPAPVLSLTVASGRQVAMEYISASLVGFGAAAAFVDVTFVMRLNGVFWRDTSETTTTPVALGAASVVASVFSGMSAPVRDAIVRVKGDVTGLKVTDARGSFFSYPAALPAGSYLRFHSDTGRAFTTTTDVWTGGTEVTGLIVNGPGPYFLELTPTFTDPSVRTGSLTVTTDTRGLSAQIEVRGKGAYLV
jgi:hypothetical protein